MTVLLRATNKAERILYMIDEARIRKDIRIIFAGIYKEKSMYYAMELEDALVKLIKFYLKEVQK